jgi:hypothetical protein
LRRAAAILGVILATAVPVRAIPWTSTAGEPPGPVVTTPIPTESDGSRFEFSPGPRHVAGYVQIPVPGDRLRADAVSVVEFWARSDPPVTLDAVLVAADCAWRAPVTFETDWSRLRVAFDDFRPDRAGTTGPIVPRFLRLEAPVRGLEHAATVDLRDVTFPAGTRATPRATAAAEAPAPVPAERRPFRGGVTVAGGRLRAEGEPYFPFGLFLLGGNRTMLESLGEAGATAVVEYGTASWPLVTVEDHLDFAQVAGVRVGVALTSERQGEIGTADVRLAPLLGHPNLLAWYLFDEPDGGPRRGVDAELCSPAALLARREGLGEEPVLVVCVSSFGLARYTDTADILATDTYWPAMGRDRSMATVHSDAEALVEIAERAGAAPLQVLQLSDPIWRDARQDPAALRAQVLGSLAAGVRGILLFQGAATLRLADEGGPGEDLWDAFLGLSSEVATWSPLAARWTRVPGEPSVSPALGEVRASCFTLGERRWIVLVNLGAKSAEVTLGGECLAGAVKLQDPADGWSGEVRDGVWEGRLGPWEGRVVRVVEPEEARPRRVRASSRVPAPAGGRAIIHYDRAVLGVTLTPAPIGPIWLSFDGEDLDDLIVHRGASAVVRRTVRGLAPGSHRVEVRWQEEGRQKTDHWSVQVRRTPVPFFDTFERFSLGDAWGVVRDVVWNLWDETDTVADGFVRIENGELHVRSTGGSIGAVLRKIEPPDEFALGFRARLESDGEIVLRRNELFRRVPLAEGAHDIVLWEAAGRQTLEVDGTKVAEWTPRVDHRRGAIALGVPPGGEAWFDDVTVQVP